MRKDLSIHWTLLTFANSMARLIIPLYLASLGYTEGQIGTLFGTASLFILAVLIAFFTHSDKVGRKFYLVLFGVFSAASAFILSTFDMYFTFFIAIVLLQASGRSLFVFGKIISIESFDASKSKTYGIFMSSFAAGSLIGNFFSGRLADLFGFQTTFSVAMIISIVSIVPLLRIKNLQTKEKSVPKNPIVYIGLLFQRMLTVLGFSVVFSFAFSLYLRSVFSLSYTSIGFIFALQGFFNMIGFMMGRFVTKQNYKSAAFITISAAAFSTIGVSLTTNLYFAIGLILISSVLTGIASTTLPHFFGQISGRLGRDVSVIEATSGSVGSAFGSFLAGLLITSFGYPSVFFASGCLLLASGITLYWIFR